MKGQHQPRISACKPCGFGRDKREVGHAIAHSSQRQTAPNDGHNTVIGALGLTIEGPISFDIVTDASGTNTAWLAANGALHSVSLETGAITRSWQIEGLDVVLRDLTVMATAE